MTIELIAFPVLVFVAGSLAAKLIERRNDVLYGPYIDGRNNGFAELREQLEATMVSLGLRQSFGRAALKLGTVGYFASAIIG